MEKIYTAKELMDKYKWDEVCNLKGINPWCINEGLMDSSYEISFNEEECREIGL